MTLTPWLRGVEGGVSSPVRHGSHHQSLPIPPAQATAPSPSAGRPAAGALLPAGSTADRLLLGSDLPRGRLGGAPALGRLGPSSDRGRQQICGLAQLTRACSGIARRPLERLLAEQTSGGRSREASTLLAVGGTPSPNTSKTLSRSRSQTAPHSPEWPPAKHLNAPNVRGVIRVGTRQPESTGRRNRIIDDAENLVDLLQI